MATYPLQAVREVTDRLADLCPSTPGDELDEMATDMVIDVTIAVDKLRATEGELLPLQGSWPEITDEMVERAARALCIEDGGDPDRTPRGHPAPVWQAFEDGARAALTAVLLPEAQR